MGLLDDLFWNLAPEGPTLFGRRARRVLRTGEAGEATIAGIVVERTTSGDTAEPEYRYALDVRTETGPATRLGVRQRLGARRGDAHLGAIVPVKVLGEKVVIDWDRHLGREPDDDPLVGTWRMVDAPAAGVEDRWRRSERKRIDAAIPGRITVLGVSPHQSAFGPTDNLDLDVELALEDGSPGSTRRLDRVLPPDYARSLVGAGAVLPVGVDKEGRRVTVDWETAANDAGGRAG